MNLPQQKSLTKLIELLNSCPMPKNVTSKDGGYYGEKFLETLDRGRATFEQEVNDMKTWLQTRLQWMDKNIELLPQKFRYTQRYRNF